MNSLELLVNDLALNVNLVTQLTTQSLLVLTDVHEGLGIFIHRSKGADRILEKEDILLVLGLDLWLEAFETVVDGQNDKKHPESGQDKESDAVLKDRLEVIHPVDEQTQDQTVKGEHHTRLDLGGPDQLLHAFQLLPIIVRILSHAFNLRKRPLFQRNGSFPVL